MQIPLSRPDVTEGEIERVVEVLRSPNLSLGPTLRRFEEAFAAYLGRRHAVAVNSGTSGLFLSLLALGIGPGDEVITTPFTFIASATSIMMTGARPVFVDIDPVSLNIDPRRDRGRHHPPHQGDPAGRGLRQSGRLGPRSATSRSGITCRSSRIAARRWARPCTAKRPALSAQMSVFGFYPNKQITTGEGGMIVTDRGDLADLCVSLRNQGRGAGRRLAGPRAARLQLPPQRHQLCPGTRPVVADRRDQGQTPAGGGLVPGNAGGGRTAHRAAGRAGVRDQAGSSSWSNWPNPTDSSSGTASCRRWTAKAFR